MTIGTITAQLSIFRPLREDLTMKRHMPGGKGIVTAVLLVFAVTERFLSIAFPRGEREDPSTVYTVPFFELNEMTAEVGPASTDG